MIPKHIQNTQLSELCELYGPDHAVAYLYQMVGHSKIPLDKQLVPNWNISEMTLTVAIASYGEQSTFKYIYDWAVHQLEKLYEINTEIENLKSLIVYMELVEDYSY